MFLWTHKFYLELSQQPRHNHEYFYHSCFLLRVGLASCAKREKALLQFFHGLSIPKAASRVKIRRIREYFLIVMYGPWVDAYYRVWWEMLTTYFRSAFGNISFKKKGVS